MSEDDSEDWDPSPNLDPDSDSDSTPNPDVEATRHPDAGSTSDSDAVVHRPDGATGAARERTFDWRGRLLVVAVFVAFVVVPVVIYVRPPGVSFTVAYLVLPLVPAVVLAVIAVWAAARP